MLLSILIEALSYHDKVEVSFEGIISASSSFVNSSFVPLLAMMSFDDIKRRVRVTRANPQIGDMIRRRITFEAHRSVLAGAAA
ncbi:STAS-like domain-containing protein [Paracoccus liaowanqingii]|nr:DUF4325 domain-containing protein [Paracoccus liaowanqingii]